MIVKNEEQCIATCLNSLKKYIDYWIISDTGSTDNTKQIILDTMQGIPGELLDHQWVDFATNRNLALDAARDKSDYTLIIDADDRLIVNDENAFSNLSSDAYRIKICHGSVEYFRPQVISNKIDYKYCGVLHEYIELPPNCSYDILNNVAMQTSFNGARNKNPNKYLDDAKVLEAALEKEPNNSRYAFYLAQSYRDCGMDEKSEFWYLQRAKMGGWSEEVYYSLMEIGKIRERLGRHPFLVESAWLEATYINPNRAETLYYLARYFRLRGNFDKSYYYAKQAAKISKPVEALFLEEECYRWKILDELSISAFYSGNHREGKAACEVLMQMIIPPHDMQRIVTNYQFYLKAAE